MHCAHICFEFLQPILVANIHSALDLTQRLGSAPDDEDGGGGSAAAMPFVEMEFQVTETALKHDISLPVLQLLVMTLAPFGALCCVDCLLHVVAWQHAGPAVRMLLHERKPVESHHEGPLRMLCPLLPG